VKEESIENEEKKEAKSKKEVGKLKINSEKQSG
jgi:hypothetical protein